MSQLVDIFFLEYAPALFKGVTNFCTGKCSGERVVTDGIAFLRIVSLDSSLKQGQKNLSQSCN